MSIVGDFLMNAWKFLPREINIPEGASIMELQAK